jgi:hypothetical protein
MSRARRFSYDEYDEHISLDTTGDTLGAILLTVDEFE